MSECREYMYHQMLSSESCPLLPACPLLSHSWVAEWKLWSDCTGWKPLLPLFWLVDYCPLPFLKVEMAAEGMAAPAALLETAELPRAGGRSRAGPWLEKEKEQGWSLAAP